MTTFKQMNEDQKKEMLQMYEDKFGIIFEEEHLDTIFGDIDDVTFDEFEYDSDDGYVDAFHKSFLYDYVSFRILGVMCPSGTASDQTVMNFINDLQDKVSKEGWTKELYTQQDNYLKQYGENYAN